jgi:hypothetical protein
MCLCPRSARKHSQLHVCCRRSFRHCWSTVHRLNLALADRQVGAGEYPSGVGVDRGAFQPWLVDDTIVAPLLTHYDALVAELTDRVQTYIRVECPSVCSLLRPCSALHPGASLCLTVLHSAVTDALWSCLYRQWLTRLHSMPPLWGGFAATGVRRPRETAGSPSRPSPRRTGPCTESWPHWPKRLIGSRRRQRRLRVLPHRAVHQTLRRPQRTHQLQRMMARDLWTLKCKRWRNGLR